MALLRCDFFSDSLELSTSMTVILPQTTSSQIGLSGATRESGTPVLYLLHGLSDDDTTWVRRTSIERYAAPLGLAVVMPQVHRSFYTDEQQGNRYWTFLSEELPGVVSSFFRVSDRREDTFVAGLSMGGYGAVKWALRHPDRFAAAASLSGSLDIAEPRRLLNHPELMPRIFGPAGPADTPEDLFRLLAEVDDVERTPALFVACGTEDPVYPSNREFVARCRRAGLPITVEFEPGEHEWGLWDRKIQDVLAWLPLT